MIKFCSIKEAAEATGLSVSYVRAGCVKGSIPHLKSGVKYYVNLPAFVELLEAECRAAEEGKQHEQE